MAAEPDTAAGQVSVEFFIAVSLFMVVLLWVSNYANVYMASTSASTGNIEVNNAATAAALAINSACAYGTNLTFKLPCVMDGKDIVPAIVNLTTNGAVTVSTPNNNALASRSILCNSSGTLVYSCTDIQGSLACAENLGDTVLLLRGNCPVK